MVPLRGVQDGGVATSDTIGDENAVAGATLNTMFTAYYQDMARGHFIIKRLESKYGFDTVRLAYGGLTGRLRL